MFYVGTYSTYRGKDSVEKTKVRDVEKLGHSIGRGKRYLDEHKPQHHLQIIDIDEQAKTVKTEPVIYRAVVFALSERFRLNNEAIRLAMKHYKCDWQTAKFHCYRIAAVDVIGNREDWVELIPAEQSTAEPLPEVNPANVPAMEGPAVLPV